MSVFPEFLEHIHDLGLYVHGHNYEEMYNVMIYNLTYNIISTNNFVYTYAQMNELYNYLEELLIYSEPEVETNPNLNNNNSNLPINDVDTINDIYTNQDNDVQDQYNEHQDNQSQDQYNQDEDNQNALQLFNNYIITTMNNHPMNNLNYTNNTNIIPNNYTYTNLVYHDNIL